MLDTAQTCPHCEGAIARENAAKVVHDDYTETWLHCEFCGYGLEMMIDADGTILPVDFFERTEPRAFGRFLQRLEDARVA